MSESVFSSAERRRRPRRQAVTVERARREPAERQDSFIDERPWGRFTRQLRLADGLDIEVLEASYEHGVLTVRIPVAEAAKPRKIAVSATTPRQLGAAA